MATSPATVTLVAATAQSVTIDGVHSELQIVPLAAGQAVFALGNGVTATSGTANEYAVLTPQTLVIPTSSANGTTTIVSLISATAGQVQVRVPRCDD